MLVETRLAKKISEGFTKLMIVQNTVLKTNVLFITKYVVNDFALNYISLIDMVLIRVGRIVEENPFKYFRFWKSAIFSFYIKY